MAITKPVISLLLMPSSLLLSRHLAPWRRQEPVEPGAPPTVPAPGVAAVQAALQDPEEVKVGSAAAWLVMVVDDG